MALLVVVIIVAFIVYRLSKKKKPNSYGSLEENGFTSTGGKKLPNATLAKINAPKEHGEVGWTLQQLIDRYGKANLEQKEIVDAAKNISDPLAAEAVRKTQLGRTSAYDVEGVYRWDIPGRMSFNLNADNVVVDVAWIADFLAEVTPAKLGEIRRDLEVVYGKPHKDHDADSDDYSWDWETNDNMRIILSAALEDTLEGKKYTQLFLSVFPMKKTATVA